MVRAKTILGVGAAKIPRISLEGESGPVFLVFTSSTEREPETLYQMRFLQSRRVFLV